MKKLNIVSFSQARLSMANQAAAYDNGTLANGYGQASGMYVTVQKGTAANIDVDFKIVTISTETYNKWKSAISEFFSQEQKKMLEKNYGGFGLAGGFFCCAFGLLFGGGDYSHYKNRSASFYTESYQKRELFSKSVYNLSTSELHIKGKLIATGTSHVPVTVSAHVQVTKIRFFDGKELHVICTDDTRIAQTNGSTEGAVSSGKVHVIPL